MTAPYDGLRAALYPHRGGWRHAPWCDQPERGPDWPCICGLDALRAALAATNRDAEPVCAECGVTMPDFVSRHKTGCTKAWDYPPLAAPSEPEPPALDYEALRTERGWPTPNHMRGVAKALDIITPASYGDILRWVADLCDASLVAHTPPTPASAEEERHG